MRSSSATPPHQCCTAGYLLTALDWTALGLSQSREQVSLVVVLVLYTLCFLVTMFSARERRHRDRSLKLSVHCEPELSSKLLSSVETTSDPGYESEETERGEERGGGGGGSVWPRLRTNRITAVMRRCGPARLLSSISRLVLNVNISHISFSQIFISTLPDPVFAS